MTAARADERTMPGLTGAEAARPVTPADFPGRVSSTGCANTASRQTARFVGMTGLAASPPAPALYARFGITAQAVPTWPQHWTGEN